MKKYVALTLTVISIICFITVFSAEGFESYKLNKGFISTNSKVKVVKNNIIVKNNIVATNNVVKSITENKHSTQLEKIEDTNSKTVYSKSQELRPISQESAIVQHSQKLINNKKPMVALTFDDGPHAEFTMSILDSLKKYNGSATFFVLGNRAEKYKSIIKSIMKNGNQIGNHTYDHKQLTKLSSKAITDEVSKTSKILKDITNIKPSLIRPTYGSVNENVKLYSGAPLILWSIDTLDWKTRNQKKIVNAVLENVKDGDIILMHDIYKTTAMASEVIIKQLSSRGYQLVTIDELYAAKGIELVAGEVYNNAHSKK